MDSHTSFIACGTAHRAPLPLLHRRYGFVALRCRHSPVCLITCISTISMLMQHGHICALQIVIIIIMIHICAHVKHPVVYVRVQKIMETLKHPVCTIGWVVKLCSSRLSLRKATRIIQGRNPNGAIQLFKKKRGGGEGSFSGTGWSEYGLRETSLEKQREGEE